MQQINTVDVARPRDIRALWRFEDGVAIRKKLALYGEAAAGQRGAIIYTLVESCRRRGQDPYAYLLDVLTRLPHMTNHQVPEVTPQVWCKARHQLQTTP